MITIATELAMQCECIRSMLGILDKLPIKEKYHMRGDRAGEVFDCYANEDCV